MNYTDIIREREYAETCIYKVASLLKKAQQAQETNKEKKEKEKEDKRQSEMDEVDTQRAVNPRSSRHQRGKYHSQMWGGLTSSLALGGAVATVAGLIAAIRNKSALTGVGNKLIDGLNKGLNQRQALPQIPDTSKTWQKALTDAAVAGGIAFGTGALTQAGGRVLGKLVGPRSLAKQRAYDASKGTSAVNLLIPGAAQFNNARTSATKDEQDAMLRQMLLQNAMEKHASKKAGHITRN